MHCKIMSIIVMLFLAWLLEEAGAEPRLHWFSRRRRRYCRKVNCELNSWTSWGRCSRTCGPYGVQQRDRSVRTPARCGRSSCRGPTHETRSCNQLCLNSGQLKYGRCSCKYGYTGECCQNGHGWTSWGPWCKCSTTCGRGTQYRTRSCHGSCSGNSKEYRSCLLKQCKGGWSSWSSWGACTGSCGTGLQIRKRSCTNPPPRYGGRNCEGPSEQHKNCFLKACPVNGGWSSWGRWAKCSKTCGGGTQSRRRYCNNPTPRYEGKTCSGSSRNIRSCNTKSCPVNGRWSPWGKWCACSKTCNGGSQYRQRYCNNPRPANGGKSCSGPPRQTRRCHNRHCPVNGGWSHWSPWEACSKTCGDGKQYSRRFCNNPKPKYGGNGCSGLSQKVQTCSLRACPVNGRWNSWASWSKCSKTCGIGSQTRRRFCTNPPPEAGGKDCTGPSQQTKSCSIKTCSVNGGWGNWAHWSTCSVTCGSGNSFRTRLCNNPTPGPGGQPCPGLSVSRRDCNLGDCDGSEECWSDWSKWCSCTKACGCGKRYRTRYCTCAFGEGYKHCKGHSEESQNCNCHACPIGPPHDDIEG